MDTFTIQLLDKIGDTLAFIALSLGAVLFVLRLAKILANSELYLSEGLFFRLTGVCFFLIAGSCVLWGFVAFGELDKALAAFFLISTIGGLHTGFFMLTIAPLR